ncbi:uncharacterized protein OCT59_015459 [Rhizophagus irregularis]|uniref:uncharacterized protein n=1 Tax=Rhizophagus irregularis TaxID=588596 RepID=UPI00333054B8|nr:hypothetical protein OCT59_015459 [Rhizophagus irregularis]
MQQQTLFPQVAERLLPNTRIPLLQHTLLVSLISLIFLSVLIEAPPTPSFFQSLIYGALLITLLLLIVRGTVPGSFKNLFTDANFITKDYHSTDGLRVHRGFYNAFLEMQPDVTDDVVNLHQERLDFRIGFMGHSLGGALATFSALDFVQKVPELANNETIVSFYIWSTKNW